MKIKLSKNYILLTSILIASIVIISTWVYTIKLKDKMQQEIGIAHNQDRTLLLSNLEEEVLPSQGVILPIVWGDLGAQLVNNGTFDAEKFKAIYESKGQFTDEYKKLLLDQNNGKLKITKDNASYILNLFWALGLANKNSILEKGEMMDPSYGGAGNFASTGGWTLAKGNAMNHYSQHKFFV